MQKSPPEVSVVVAHAESVPLTRESVGLLAASRVAQVRARVAGIILKRVYTEGTDVKPGQILFQIDPAPLQATLRTEEAELASARANAANAALIAKRYQDLSAKGLLASQDLDTAQATVRTTAAAVKAARANVAKARLNLGYATVTAPIAGRAGRALVTEGALVGQGEATQLTTIEQIDPLYVNFSQPVDMRQRLPQAANADRSGNSTHSDHSVAIILPNGTPYPYPTTLNFSNLAVNPRTGTRSLRAVVPNPEQRLLPGMYVKLRVTLGRLEHAFKLPQATILRDSVGAYVLVVDATGKVQQQRVQTHGMTRSDWIITGKLVNSARVIVDGLQKVKPGMKVKVVPATRP